MTSSICGPESLEIQILTLEMKTSLENIIHNVIYKVVQLNPFKKLFQSKRKPFNNEIRKLSII